MAAQNPRIHVSALEQALHTIYTIDTVTALQRRFPGVHFVWLMGSDNLVTFHRWRRWREIAKRVPIAVMMRPGSTLAPLSAKASQFLAAARKRPGQGFARKRPPALTILDGQRCPISATAIRAKTGWGEALVHAIPPC
jgi:nicotinate-nucleotide adenylyltransferase